MDCLFCKIVSGEIPSKKVYEDEEVVAFKDLYPQAKLHYLFIHKNHTSNVSQMMSEDASQVTAIFKAITSFAQSEGLESSGYRIVNNLGKDGGQTVFHTHFHLLAGEQLKSFGS
jgi:histidine triad (HIT) family protein